MVLHCLPSTAVQILSLKYHWRQAGCAVPTYVGMCHERTHYGSEHTHEPLWERDPAAQA